LELIPPLKRAQDAGIVIINIDNRLDADLSKKSGLKDVPYVGVDNEKGGYLSAMELVRRLTGPNEAAILEGIPTSQNSIDRVAGAQRAFAENPQIELVIINSAHWKIDEGYEVTRELLAQFPNIKALFCATDMMALGAVQYLQDAGMQGVLVAGYDNLSEVQDALKQGALVATIDQQAAEQGYLGVQYAVRALKNETLPAETLVDVHLVTAGSLP
jgi:ribose transport system substrate-binding protein